MEIRNAAEAKSYLAALGYMAESGQITQEQYAAEEARIHGLRKQWDRGRRVSLGVAAAFTALLVVILALTLGGGSEPKTLEEKQAASYTDVLVLCRDAVKQQLKAPSTADFGGEAVKWSGSTATMTGVVDAENSFGAMIRTPWTCTASVDLETQTAERATARLIA